MERTREVRIEACGLQSDPLQGTENARLVKASALGRVYEIEYGA